MGNSTAIQASTRSIAHESAHERGSARPLAECDNIGMSSSESSAPDGWDEQIATQIPELQKGHRDARRSYETIIATVVIERRRHHRESTKTDLELIAIIASLDYELKTLILRLVEAPSDRAVWHKYLALLLWQVLEELPSLLGSGLQAEGKFFKDAVRGIRKDRVFMEELIRIRNGVAAHLGLAKDGPGRIEWSFDSVVSASRGEPAILTSLVIRAMEVSAAVHQLGSSLIRKHIAIFPGAKV